MNKQKLIYSIKEYKKHITKIGNIEAINERKVYYQEWTKEKIKAMTEEEFVEYIGKLWSMLVWGNKKYIAN